MLRKLIFILLLSTGSSFADQISWPSGDKTVTGDSCSGGDCANDTLLSTGSFSGKLNLESTTEGITCVLTGHTFTYTGGIGLNIKGDDTKIVGGTFSFSGSSGDGNMGVKIQGHDVLLENVSASVGGDNAIAIMASGNWDVYNVEIDGGTFSSSGTGFNSRCDYDAPVVKFDHLRDEADVDFLYHVYMHDATITDGPWAGITIQGRTQDGPDVNHALAWIDDNTITTDHRNDTYASYSGLCNSSANPYGIILRTIKEGSRIKGNNITSGTTYGGNRGILLERSWGTEADPVIIRNNTINVHEGPNVEYGAGGLPVHGIRVRYSNHYVLIDSNTVTTTTDDNSGTDHTDLVAHAVRISQDKSYTNIVLRNNTITATSSDVSNVDNMAIVFGAIEAADNVFSYNNNITSNGTIYQFTHGNGSRSTSGSNTYIEGDTVQFGTPQIASGYKTIRLGYLCNPWYSEGNEMRDVVFNGSASHDDVTFWCGNNGNRGELDIKQTRTLNLYAKGANGLPVVGATITAVNAYGVTAFTGSTNYNGKLTGVASYYYEHHFRTDSTAFNDFTLTATYSGDEGAGTLTVSQTAAGGTDTLLLPNTDGTGQWGEPVVPANEPPSFVTGVTAVSTTPVDRNDANTTVVSTVFQDVDDPGIAAFTVTFKLRYPNNITEIILVNAQTTGNGGLTIVEDSTAWYTASYSYNPAADQTLGVYDLYAYVTDGTGYDEDGFSGNIDELTIGETLTLSQTLTVIDTNNVTLSIEDNFANQSSLDSVYLLFGTSNPPTTRLDSIGTVTDPDTFSVTDLAPATTYHYRGIAVDAVSRDTSSVGTIITLNTVAHSLTHIDSGGGYAAGEGYFNVENNYTANTVSSMTLVWGTSTSIGSATGDTTILSGYITDPDTLGCDTLSANNYYYWWIITDQLGADTSAMQAITVPLGGLRFGHWNLDSTYNGDYTVEDKKRMVYFTFDGATNSTLDTIYARLTNNGAFKLAQAALFGADSVLIDTSDQVTINTQGTSWWAFPMANADTLTNGTSYGLSVWGDGGDGTLTHVVTEYAGISYFLETEAYAPANWDPWTSDDTATSYCPLIFGVYSASAPTIEVELRVRGKVIFRGNVQIGGD